MSRVPTSCFTKRIQAIKMFDSEAELSGDDSGEDGASEAASNVSNLIASEVEEQDEASMYRALDVEREYALFEERLANIPIHHFSEEKEEIDLCSEDEKTQVLAPPVLRREEAYRWDQVKEGADGRKGNYKGFVFTSYEEKEPDYDSENMEYLVYQQERCPTTQRLHWQGYVEFKHKVTFKQAIAAMMYNVNKGQCKTRIFVRKGTPKQARDYCMDEDTQVQKPKEFGTFKELEAMVPGKRRDLDEVADMILNKKAKLEEVVRAHPTAYIKYGRGIEKLMIISMEPRSEPCRIVVIVGQTGCGKSHWISQNYPNAYYKNNGDEWWCGYSGQTEAVIEEVEYNRVPALSTILKVADKFPVLLSTKGGHVQCKIQRLFITSNTWPENWWPNRDLSAFYRRVEKFLEVTEVQKKTIITDKTDKAWNPVPDRDFSAWNAVKL